MGQEGARGIHRLTAIEVHKAAADANDGGGLLLRVQADRRAAWVWRFTSPAGKRRELGLGQCHRGSQKLAGESIAHARKLAADARAQLAEGIDPVAARQDRRADEQAREAKAKADAATKRDVEHWTLARCARDYHERVVEPKLSSKHAAQWIASLENHVPADVWHAPIVTVTAPRLVAALLAMKLHKRARHLGSGDRLGETRSRVLQRLATVFDDAVFHNRAASNPPGAPRGARSPKRRPNGAVVRIAPCPSVKRPASCTPSRRPMVSRRARWGSRC